MRSALVLASANLLAACVPAVELRLPDPEPARRSVILLLEDTSVAPPAVEDVWAFALPGEIAVPFSRSRSLALTAIYYDETLEALQLPAGRIALAPEGRPLPNEYEEIVSAPVERDGFGTFAPREEPPFVRLDLAFSLADCAAAGGCVANEAQEVCILPCPSDPAVLPPQPPELAAPSGPFAHPVSEWLPEEPDEDGIVRFAPRYPATATCSMGQVQHYGEPACSAVGAPCPAGQWPAQLPAGVPVLRVDEAAPHGGDGSEQAPYATLDDAIRAATEGTYIALAAGSYTASSAISADGITIAGACAERVTIVPGPRSSVTLPVTSRTFVLRDVTVIGGSNAAVEVIGGQATLQGVLISAMGAHGVVASSSANVQLTEAGVVDAQEAALFSRDGSSLDATRTSVRLTQGAAATCGSASLSFRESALRTSGSSINAGVQAHQCTVAFTESRIEGFATHGVYLDGGEVAAEWLSVEGIGGAAIVSVGATGARVHGLHVADASGALNLHLAEGTAVLRDVRLERSRIQPSGAASIGFSAGGSGTVTLERYAFSGDGLAVYVANESRVHLALSDLLVDANERIQHPAVTLGPGTVTGSIARALIRGSPDQGLSIHEDVKIDIHDLLVRGARRFGIVVNASFHRLACARFNRVRFEDPRHVGVAMQTGVEIQMRDVSVQSGGAVEVALQIAQERGFDLERFELRGPGAVGLLIQAGIVDPVEDGRCYGRLAPLQLNEGRIAGFGTGALIERLSVPDAVVLTDVTYEDNLIAIDRTD